MLPGFRLHCYRIHLRARDPVMLPFFSGSTLRGAFAATFKRLVCQQTQRDGCASCMLEGVCAYPAVFESRPPEGAANTSGFAQFPRPYVVAPPAASHGAYREGAALSAGLTLIGRGNDYLPYFLVALSQLAEAGVGRGRGRVTTERVEALHPLSDASAAVWEGPGAPVRPAALPVTWEQAAAATARLPGDWLTIRFLTPTCLTSGRQMAPEPSFVVLVRCLLRRLTRLSQAYCGAETDLDYPGLFARAAAVRTAAAALEYHGWERYSRRQDRRVPARGVVGSITYAGPVAEFLPLVLLGSLTHVGDNAVMGQGRYVMRHA